ncbi:MAG: ABC transporter permease [Myxococcota bacterium]
MRHLGCIAGRELRSLFVSPVAYVVLTLWAVLAGFFFLSNLIAFQTELVRMQQMGAFEMVRSVNLNDHLIAPFMGSMWIILIFAVPGVTMGLFAAEKANGTDELLLTSPLTIWEIVLGKFLAGAAFVALMTGIVAFFPAILFAYGDPEVGKTGAGLLGLLLVSLTYVAVGAFASSVTRNHLIAFFLAFGVLLLLLMLPFIAELGASRGGLGGGGEVAELMRWVATGSHFEQLLKGLVDTKDLVYFAVMSGSFLFLTKAAMEASRWR